MSIRVKPEIQLHFLERDITPLFRAVVKGMEEDPGHSDLDDEQPVHVTIPLGEYRRAKRILYELEKAIGKS